MSKVKPKKRLLDEAEKYNCEAAGYIHASAKDGKHEGTYLCGEPIMIMHLMNSCIMRIAKLTDTRYEDVIGAMQELREIAEELQHE